MAGVQQGQGQEEAKGPAAWHRQEGHAGIAKLLARNGQLPPGLEYHPLPHDLIVQLPPLRQGHRYVIADNRVMLIQAASNFILDVMTVAALDLLN